jgi:hypothetical protein
LDDQAGMLDLKDFFYFVQVVDRGGSPATSRALRFPAVRAFVDCLAAEVPKLVLV